MLQSDLYDCEFSPKLGCSPQFLAPTTDHAESLARAANLQCAAPTNPPADASSQSRISELQPDRLQTESLPLSVVELRHSEELRRVAAQSTLRATPIENVSTYSIWFIPQSFMAVLCRPTSIGVSLVGEFVVTRVRPSEPSSPKYATPIQTQCEFEVERFEIRRNDFVAM